jgi:hypothetical protein
MSEYSRVGAGDNGVFSPPSFMRVGADLSNPYGPASTDSRPTVTINEPFKSEIVTGGFDKFTGDEIALARQKERLALELSMYMDADTKQPKRGMEDQARKMSMRIDALNTARDALAMLAKNSDRVGTGNVHKMRDCVSRASRFTAQAGL